MLQQTQVGIVLPYYKDWLRRFPNFAALARASEAEALHAWQGLGTTIALEIFMPPQKSSQPDIVAISRSRSSSCNNFPESGNTPPTPLPHSLSIGRWPLSRRILRAFYHVCSICEFRSIRLLDGTHFGMPPPLSLQKRPRPHIIQRFSILVR